MHVTKWLQSEKMLELRKTEASFVSYRGTRFASAQVSAKEVCEEINFNAILKKRRMWITFEHLALDSPAQGSAVRHGGLVPCLLSTRNLCSIVTSHTLKKHLVTWSHTCMRQAHTLTHTLGGWVSLARKSPGRWLH